MSMERFTISMGEADIDLFERGRADMGMSKSAFIRFLIAEHENKVPSFLKYREVIEMLSELNTSVKELILSNRMDDVEKLHIFEKIEKINEVIRKLLE